MPRFVVLKHAWDGVHWDVMLESGGVLRTWAVDAPLAAGVDMPARALPDHRLAYLDFEGPISRGRGTVRRVDRGTYRARLWEPGRVVVDLRGAQLAGELTLFLSEMGAEPVASAAERRWTLRFGGKVV